VRKSAHIVRKKALILCQEALNGFSTDNSIVRRVHFNI
jgi:hypothetical protein